MARFYARFDSGSAGWESGFAAGLVSSGYFNRLRITVSSASAALLRNGLIASRSLLSTDIYADLDDVNEDGSKGTYFPPDLLSTDSSTYVSWSSAYTSSVEGIKTPTSNTYGTGNVNYSLRVTASILSSSNLVGRTTPIDPVGASYTAYINASNAVKAVLDVAQTGNGTLTTPYTRTGYNSSRTLHSIWYDPDLQYFGRDDFTPGKPPTPTLAPVGSGNITVTVTDNSVIGSNLYVNDANPAAPIGFVITIGPSADGTCPAGTGNATLNLSSGSATLVANGIGALTHGTSAGPFNGPTNPFGGGTSTWSWNHNTKEIQWQIVVDGSKNYAYSAYVIYYDPIIQTHVSQSDAFLTDFPGCV